MWEYVCNKTHRGGERMRGSMHGRVGHAYLKMHQLLADEPCRAAQEDGQKELSASRFALPWPAAGHIRCMPCKNCGRWRLHTACAPAEQEQISDVRQNGSQNTFCLFSRTSASNSRILFTSATLESPCWRRLRATRGCRGARLSLRFERVLH